MISRHKISEAPKIVDDAPVASAATLALCGSAPQSKEDPWSKQDPWQQYAPVSKPSAPANAVPDASESLQQLESRIQSAVLSRLPQAMEQDDVPDRLQLLEGQVQSLMQQHGKMETQFLEFSSQQTQTVSNLQNQLNVQAQQMHGQLEQQSQNIQAMFETQLSHIRGLLSKRPREDGE